MGGKLGGLNGAAQNLCLPGDPRSLCQTLPPTFAVSLGSRQKQAVCLRIPSPPRPREAGRLATPSLLASTVESRHVLFFSPPGSSWNCCGWDEGQWKVITPHMKGTMGGKERGRHSRGFKDSVRWPLGQGGCRQDPETSLLRQRLRHYAQLDQEMFN